MDIFSANMDPVADAIKGIGTGFVNNALKKIEIDRQLGKDIYDAAKTEAAINWDRARTRNQNLKTDNLQKLSALFNPESFNQKERAAIGAGAMLGSSSFNDIMKGVDTQQTTGFRADQYAKGTPMAKLSIALDKEISPYRYDSRTGAVYNTMDGTVNIDPNVVNHALNVGLALKVAGGNGTGDGKASGGGKPQTVRLASPSELVTVFSDVIYEKDPLRGMVPRTVRNDKALNEFIAFSEQNGIPMTAENAWLYKAGALVGDMANLPVPVSGVQVNAPVQTPDEKPADVLPGTQAVRDVKRTVSPDMAAGLEMIRQKLRSGRYLNDEEALNALRMLGFE